MANERLNPFSDMLTLRQAMDRLLEDSFVRPGSGMLPMAQGGGSQVGFPIDVADTDDAFEVRATLPGVRPDDVQITVHNDTLLIRGQSTHEEERTGGQGRRWLVKEHRSQSFQRAIGLPMPVDPDHAEARFENGVLLLTLPKSEAARPRQIQIRQPNMVQEQHPQINSAGDGSQRGASTGSGAMHDDGASAGAQANPPQRSGRSRSAAG